jgi:hypothetical protein
MTRDAILVRRGGSNDEATQYWCVFLRVLPIDGRDTGIGAVGSTSGVYRGSFFLSDNAITSLFLVPCSAELQQRYVSEFAIMYPETHEVRFFNLITTTNGAQIGTFSRDNNTR